MRQPCWGMVTKPGLWHAYFRIQAYRDAAPVNETNNRAFPIGNRAVLVDIPNNASNIAAAHSSSTPRNNAAPVSGSHNHQDKNPGTEATATTRGFTTVG
jgi:hypothetical protein